MAWRLSPAGSSGGASRGRRGMMRGLGAPRLMVVAVVAALLVSTMPTTAAGETLPPAPDASAIPEMGEYPESDFVQAAAELPAELVAAVERDLGLSPEQYLAQAEAASDASDLVEYLATEGIDASDRRLDGTTLTIGVESAAEASVVEQSGAEAVIGTVAPELPFLDDATFEPAADVYGGDVITWFDGSGRGARCSVGANGTNASNQPELVTAGHCTDSTLGNGGLYRHVTISTPGFSPSGTGQNIGSPRPGSFRAGGGYDAGLLTVTQPGFTTGPTVTTFSGGQGARSGGLISVRDTIIPTTGSPICKSGATTGWTCGQILDDLQSDVQVCGGPSCYSVDAIVTNMCMLGGDSGGSGMVGSAFVGVNSATQFGSAPPGYGGTPLQFCAAAVNKVSVLAIMRHNPGVSTIESLYGSSWEPTVRVDSPTISLPPTYTSGVTLTVSGGITNVTPRTRIEVKVNGVSRSVVLDTVTGAWSATVPAVTGSSVSVTVQARWGLRSVAPLERFVADNGGSFVPRTLTIDRIAGTDRYDVAIAIAQRAYPPTGTDRPTTVYVVNGGDFPDALGAGSAAAATGGLVMLVETESLASKIRTEMQRLSPQRVVIVGGPASVSEAVRASLQSALPSATVSRISGASRFEVSLNVMNHIIATGGPRAFDVSTNLYVANGFNYPDALVAGAAGSSAASFRGISPVLTVAGPESTLPASTRTAIENFGFSTIMVAGGPGSVSTGIESQLRSIVGTSNVLRLGGATRFDAARSVSNDAYRTTADIVFLTTGFNFPDALAGAPLAGLLDAPMYSVETTCVPRNVLADLDRLLPSRIILLGGTGTLTPAVAALTPCP